MTTQLLLQASAAASPDPGLVQADYEEEAAALITMIEAFHAAVPAIEVPVGMKLNTPVALVKDELLATALGLYENAPDLQRFQEPDMAAVRDALRFGAAFRPVIERLTAELRSLQLQLRLRRAQASAAALQVYALAKGVAQATPGVQYDAQLDILKHQVTAPPRKKRRPTTSSEKTQGGP
jgi:hypothetical protein